MDVTGIFITKIPREQGLATIEQFCQKYINKTSVNDTQKKQIFKAYCRDLIDLIDTCFETELWGVEKCKRFINQQAAKDDINIINNSFPVIYSIILELKGIITNAIPISDFPSCKKLLELSPSDMASAAKDLVKNNIIKATTSALLLGKTTKDVFEISHVLNFYNEQKKELAWEIQNNNRPISPIEKFLMSKYNIEITYCSEAMVKAGISITKEIKSLLESINEDKNNQYKQNIARYQESNISIPIKRI